jgi:peptidoglycan hydrolase-like protein with peptidoglycan-binding domain
MPDAELAGALKAAKAKPMYFAFIPKGAGDGKLIVSKTKISPKLIAEAKKAMGGAPVTGKCSGPPAAMIFQVSKAAPGTLVGAIKKVAQRDAGFPIIAEFQVAADADADEADADEAPAAAAAAPAAAPAAPPAARGQANVLGIQKALQRLGYDPGKIDGVSGPQTHAAIKKFQAASGLAADGIPGAKTQAALAKALAGGAAARAAPAAGTGATGATASGAPASAAAAPNLAPWQAARQIAITDLKALAAKIIGTKHRSAAGVLKEIQSIITRLPANPPLNAIDQLEEFVRHDDTITAAEDIPGHFHKLDIRGPLLQALEGLKQ